MTAAGQTSGAPPLAVYVHWPYCARICPYCDFNVYKARTPDADAWAQALCADLKYWARRTGARQLASLYFGGGTPSLCPPSVLRAVIETARELWPPATPPEITLEANPTDAEQALFSDMAALGVNRLSLGVQSFDDDQLSFLGRNHDGANARRALETALHVFDRVSFDLIYALPNETADAWRKRLREALKLGAGHLSAYQLTIEPNTAFDKAVARRAWTPLDDDVSADLFDMTQEETARADLPAYEISNHARPGEESRHNFAYWRGEDYVGVGPGAHGRLTIDGRRIAFETARNPQNYLTQCNENGHGIAKEAALSEEEAFTERLAMGLRSREGVALDADAYATIAVAAAPLIEDGLCAYENGRLVAREDGRRVLNAVIAALLS